ncbi:MAG TPA: TetR/AcrR family transcriptional regulator [Candidatus Eisenbacteria bacterium]|nr:TetR/AcrR family transcriptional regulator [Candidatus Eisenbacteria bacterium]
MQALVEKGGYEAATIEAVAERSGVAKTTIYRWWPNRAALVVDLLVEVASRAAPPTGTGEPLAELRHALQLVGRAAEGLSGRLLIALLGEAEHDPDIRTALRNRLFRPRRKATAAAIKRAQDDGLLRRDISPLAAGDLLYGPMFYRKFIRFEPVTRGFVDQAFECVLTGLQGPAARAGAGGARHALARRRRPASERAPR